MPVSHNIVSDDTQRLAEVPSDLENREIHPIFCQEAFRYADYSRYLSLHELDKETYDFPEVLYDRMKPALRLATVFLRIIMPELARIRYAPVSNQMTDCGDRDQVLSNSWSYTPHDIAEFDRKVLRQMCDYYRFTLLTKEHAADLRGIHSESARTSALVHHENRLFRPMRAPIYPQTGLNSQWLWFLTRLDWKTMPTEKKYGKYFLLATTLIHELAHAVWLDRVLQDVSNYEVVFSADGEFNIKQPEPRLLSQHLFAEVGYAIEIQLFGGLPGLSNFGSPSRTEKPCGEGESHRVPFSFVDTAGRVVDIHQISRRTIYSFFDTGGSLLWGPFEYGDPPDFEMELLENDGPPRRRLSTVLSDPPALGVVPIVKIPDPSMLEPAITADNELVRGSDGKMPPQKKSRSRSLKLRIRALFR